MRILHVIGSMDPASGGPCQGIRNIDSEMVHLGVSREVVSLDDPNAAFLGTDDFPVHAMGPTKGAWQYTPKIQPWLKENINRFDVVIINGIWLYCSYITYKTLSSLRKQNIQHPDKKKLPAIFVMPHGMLDPYFQKAEHRKLKAIRNSLYWRFIEKKIINNVDGILFTCEVELQLAKQAFEGYAPKRQLNVGYGVTAPELFLPKMSTSFIEKCPDLKDEPYLLFLSRIHTKKGVDLLIEAYASIKEQAKNSNLKTPKLVIAGPGLDTDFGRRILALVRKSPLLQNSVFFTGMLTGDAKWGAIYGCEAFILPSHQENFGIAIVEAMACKKPVLISNQVNIWIEIKETGGGIVANDTLEGTKNLLLQWINLPLDQKNDMGKLAFIAFEKHFDIRQTSLSFLNAINSD